MNKNLGRPNNEDTGLPAAKNGRNLEKVKYVSGDKKITEFLK